MCFKKSIVRGLLLLTVAEVFFPHGSQLAHAYFQKEKRVTLSTVWDLDPQDLNSQESLFINQLSRLLGLLPSEHYQSLKQIVFQPEAERRGLVEGHDVIFNLELTDDLNEAMAVFVHELGHIVDVWTLTSANKTELQRQFSAKNLLVYQDDPSLEFYRLGWVSLFQPKNKNSAGFVSGYSLSNIFEDFAETYLAYVLHGSKTQELAEKSLILNKKYEFMRQQVFGGKEYHFSETTSHERRSEQFDVTLWKYDLKNYLAKGEQERRKRETVARTSRTRPARMGRVGRS